MAEMVGSVLVQEALSKAVSFVLGKREEKASEALNAERLEMAVSQLEFALERTAKLPVTEASLLHRRKIIRRAYLEGTQLLNKHHKSLEAAAQAQGRPSLKRKRWWMIRGSREDLLPAGLKTDDVRKFVWFADHAGKFLRDVESGCSLRHHTFCSPHVRHLLEGRTLRYEEKVLQGSQLLLRRLCVQPVRLEGRGVETVLIYQHRDCKKPQRSFNLVLILRLSESTDIARTATACLRWMASLFKLNKHVAESAVGELTLMPSLQCTTSHPSADRYRAESEIDLDSYGDDSRYLRPDPICCRENGHGPCANGVLPEEVIHFFFRCSVSALDCSFPARSPDKAGKARVPLDLTIGCLPHHVYDDKEQQLLQGSYALEIIGQDGEERGDVSIQRGGETLKSKAATFFVCQPELTEYRMLWITRHGVAGFFLEKPSTGRVMCAPKTKTNGRLSSRMAVACHRSMSLQKRSIKPEEPQDLGHGHTCPFGPWAV